MQPELNGVAVEDRQGAPHQAVTRLANASEAGGLDRRGVGDLTRGLGRARLAEDVTLDHADAELADQLQVVVGFDAFRARVHVQRLREGDDGADDRGIAVRRRCGPADEALVDLDLVERRLLQIAERAVTGAEVVEREADAKRLQLGERVVGRVAFSEEHALGDLELQPFGAEARLAQVFCDHVGDGRIVELQRRQVDRDADMVGPVHSLFERGAEHPLADLAD